MADYGGEIPRDIDELQKLPGVGRKTANVVLNEAFGIVEASRWTRTCSASRIG